MPSPAAKQRVQYNGWMQLTGESTGDIPLWRQMLGRLHGRQVLVRRQAVIADTIAGMIPGVTTFLDVGCGDGRIGCLVAEHTGARPLGVEMYPRGGESIPVEPFDGVNLPYGDDQFGAVVISDVLHHVPDGDGQARLIEECARVAPIVVIKDHLCDNLLARLILSGMDWVGNQNHGVPLPLTYLSTDAWTDLYLRAGLRVVMRTEGKLGLYGGLLSFFFEGGNALVPNLHFVDRLERISP